MAESEMIQMLGIVAAEKDIPLEDMVSALEVALATAISKRMRCQVRVQLDRVAGDYLVFRRWEVVENETDLGVDLHDEPIEFNAELHITLPQAKEQSEEHSVGDFIEEPLTVTGLGRIAAQTARQVIKQKVREAERAQVALLYEGRVGTLVNGLVKRVTRDYIILDLGNNAEAVLLREEMLPREAVRIGDRLRAYLYEIRTDAKGPQLFVSRAKREMLVELFRIEVPEIGEEIIEVKAAARDPGSRAKIAVKTNDGRIDPIGACIGMRGSRVQAVSNELGGERIDVILWNDSPAQFVINAMAPAEVGSIVMDEDRHAMDIAVDESQLSQAIGRSGQNIRLASELSGWILNVMTVEDMENKSAKEVESSLQLFMNKLDVDEDVSAVLVEEGFTSLDEVAFVALQELSSIEGFDEEIALELQQRAKEIVEKEGGGGKKVPAEDLLKMDGMDEALAYQLAAHDIVTMEDLAEQAVDDVLDVVRVDKKRISQLIMKAREPWFK